MPFLRLTMSPAAAAELADPDAAVHLAGDLRRLMADVLGKKPELTAVLVEGVPAATWTVGEAVSSRAAHLEATITAGTNTPAEKAAFIRAAMALLDRTLGPLPEASYIVLTEVPADGWGYGGRTQAERRGTPAI